MANTEHDALVELIDAEIERIRQEEGSYVDYGTPPTWLIEARATITTLAAENARMAEALGIATSALVVIEAASECEVTRAAARESLAEIDAALNREGPSDANRGKGRG